MANRSCGERQHQHSPPASAESAQALVEGRERDWRCQRYCTRRWCSTSALPTARCAWALGGRGSRATLSRLNRWRCVGLFLSDESQYGWVRRREGIQCPSELAHDTLHHRNQERSMSRSISTKRTLRTITSRNKLQETTKNWVKKSAPLGQRSTVMDDGCWVSNKLSRKTAAPCHIAYASSVSPSRRCEGRLSMVRESTAVPNPEATATLAAEG